MIPLLHRAAQKELRANRLPVRQLCGFVAVLAWGICSCATTGCDTGRYSDASVPEGFEEHFVNGVPAGWSVGAVLGTYRVGQSPRSRHGESSLAIAGSGGEVRVQAPSLSAPAEALVRVEGWYQLGELTEPDFAMNVNVGDTAHEIPVIEPTIALDRDDGPDARAGWRLIRFFGRPVVDPDAQSVPVQFMCRGSGLVRIDDYQATVVGRAVPEFLIADPGFESTPAVLEEGVWRLVRDAAEASVSKSARSAYEGNQALRVSGRRGWIVVSHAKKIPASHKVYAQGFVKASHGRASLKFDYYRNGEVIGSTYSQDVSAPHWTHVTVEGEASKLAAADAVCVCVTASNHQGAFNADFDGVEVFACQP